MSRKYRVLFICTANSARSILAEAITNQSERFEAYSAGSHPGGRVHPMALELLHRLNLPTKGLRSKSWDEFTGDGAPVMDLVITVCDQAAGESCPRWPGQPITANWSVPDPAQVVGDSEVLRKAFANTLYLLQQRIALVAALRPEALDRVALANALRFEPHNPVSD